MIYTIEDYYSKEGMHIKKFVVVSGDKPDDFPEFVGVGVIEMQLGPQIIPRQFSANIDAATLEEAFEKAPEVMEKAGEKAKETFEQELREEMQRQQTKIVVPD